MSEQAGNDIPNLEREFEEALADSERSAQAYAADVWPFDDPHRLRARLEMLGPDALRHAKEHLKKHRPVIYGILFEDGGDPVADSPSPSPPAPAPVAPEPMEPPPEAIEPPASEAPPMPRPDLRVVDQPPLLERRKEWAKGPEPEPAPLAPPQVLPPLMGEILPAPIEPPPVGSILPAAPGRNLLDTLAGDSQIVCSQFLNRGAAAGNAVARLVRPSGNSSGTGFLIGPNLLMTNQHVLKNIDVARARRAQFDFLGTDERQPQMYELNPDRFYFSNAQLDYAIVYVESKSTGTPLADRGALRLIAASGKALRTERVNIIQHPGQCTQMVAFRDNRVVGPHGCHIWYYTDTQKGSSGSPVFNDQWELAALHRRSIPERRNGRIVLKDGTLWRNCLDNWQIRWKANAGVRISCIVDDLKASMRTDAWWTSYKMYMIQECIVESPHAPAEPPPTPENPRVLIRPAMA